MTEGPPDFRLYSDYSLTPAYTLGHAFHALGRVGPRTAIHGRSGVARLVDELIARVQALDLPRTLAAAAPLRLLHDELAGRSRFARLGTARSDALVATLPPIERAAGAELRVRSAGRKARAPLKAGALFQSTRKLLGEAGYRNLPDHLHADLAEGCRAIVCDLPTAGVFHLRRVWVGPISDSQRNPPGKPAVPDPGRDPKLRCTEADARALLARIRTVLQSSDSPYGSR